MDRLSYAVDGHVLSIASQYGERVGAHHAIQLGLLLFGFGSVLAFAGPLHAMLVLSYSVASWIQPTLWR